MSNRDFYYDDTRLQRLFEALTPKQRAKALRGGLRKAAYNLRKAAVKNLRDSGLASNPIVEKGIRALVYKGVLGMRVTIGTRKKGGDIRTWVPLWAEGGTDDRRTRKGRYRGRMGAPGATFIPGFMTRTLQREGEKQGTNLKTAIINYIEKTAKKYGCS